MAVFGPKAYRLLVAAAVTGALATASAKAHRATNTAAPVNPAIQESVPPNATTLEGPDPFAAFAPSGTPIKHKIDYSIWTEALSNFVISMGPPLRKNPNLYGRPQRREAHNSLYRLDGSMVGFSFMDDAVKESFTQYRIELEGLADKLDIQSLPRNEQLAFWLNLHNVALVEQIAYAWPIREPRRFLIDGVPLDEAKFITVKGTPLSPRDIRTKIVYPNWKDARVIYGFWRGEIGGPSMRREAFEAQTVSRMLSQAATEFINSRRGTEKRGRTLHVSQLYEEAAEFYFPEFNADLRAHLLKFTNEEMTKRVNKTTRMKTTLRDFDIADLAGGSRYRNIRSRDPWPNGVSVLVAQRARKFDYMERKGISTGTVTFSNITLPGDEENVEQVE